MILRTRQNLPSRPRARRAGFTLLEILLASLIAALLMAALYMALNMTLQQTQATRDAVESEDLARGVFNKMSIDLSGTLAPLPPKSGGNSAASAASTTSAAAAADPTAAAAAPTDPTMAGTEDTTATPFTAAPLFQGGVVGQEQMLILFLGKVPESFGRYAASEAQVRSDQRQVIYKFVPGRGLYRVERPWVTADNLTMDLDPDAPDSVLLADEVVSLLFEFSDGSSWVSTWDGTVPGPDGVTPLGPPRAVRVTLTLTLTAGKGELTKEVSQVISVRSAPGTYTPPLLEAPTEGATDMTGATPASGSTPSTPSSGSTPAASGSTPSTPATSSKPAASGSTPSAPSGGSSMPSTPSSGTSGKTGTSTGAGSGGKAGGGK